MRVLIGCEESGVVRREFRKLGHEAWSCDILPSRDGSPHHLQCDLLEVIDDEWDMGIFFPPCTHLCVSGARHFKKKRKDGRQQSAIDFFMRCWDNKIKKVAIENPVCIMSTIWRKPDQIIHPWWFGHMEQKTTCIWKRNLCDLDETDNVYEEMMKLPKAQRCRVHHMPPSPLRSLMRSETFLGVAKAFAKQWGTPPKRAKKPSAN